MPNPNLTTAQERDEKIKALTGTPRERVAGWKQEWEDASKDEEDWRKDADEAQKAHSGEDDSNVTEFNIFHSNTEILCPAIYNTPPTPDIRRRFNDKDVAAKEVSELLERSITYSLDAYDFDSEMTTAVKHMVVTGRGQIRVRYRPGQRAMPNDRLKGQAVECEVVPWASYRQGAARSYNDVPWVGFEHFMTRKEVRRLLEQSNRQKLISKKQIEDAMERIPFTWKANTRTGDDDRDGNRSKEVSKFGGRCRVAEIWDRDTKLIYFICFEWSEFELLVSADPLRLRKFFPVPKPMMAIEQVDSLTPLTPYRTYSALIQQLNDISERITKLTRQCRVRGGYVGIMSEIELIAKADDGELVPLKSAEGIAQTGKGIEGAITWFPIEIIANTLKVLVEQRELVKQTIYEVTGMSDIMRGATDPNETLGAQQIKTQWGSIRVQSYQRTVARFARDIIEMKAEIIANKFEWETLTNMTGLRYPTQQEIDQAQQTVQQAQEAEGMMQQGAALIEQGGLQMDAHVQQRAQMLQQQIEAGKSAAKLLEQVPLEVIDKLLRDDATRNFRVDIESDSTIRADLTKNQEMLKGFLEGVAAYLQSIGALVEKQIMPPAAAAEILVAFSRQYKLGKQAEDGLDKWVDKLREAEENPQPQQQPDPVAQAEADLKKAQAQDIPERLKLDQKTQADHKDIEMAKINAKKETDIEAHRANAVAKHVEGQRAEREHGLKERQQDFAEQSGAAEMEQADRHLDQTQQHEAGMAEQEQAANAEAASQQQLVDMASQQEQLGADAASQDAEQQAEMDQQGQQQAADADAQQVQIEADAQARAEEQANAAIEAEAQREADARLARMKNAAANATKRKRKRPRK